MRIGRTLPPAASPIGWHSFFCGLAGLLSGDDAKRRFRDELRGYFAVRHCFMVSSGKAALTLTLKALHQLYPDRDEVLIPAYTCYSVPSTIVRAGLKVKLCDLAPDKLDFDHEQLRPLLDNKRLLCVIPTHLYGLPADVERLRSMVTDPEVTIVEDAAQAFGTEHQGKKLGTLGDVGFFSLGRGKAFSTVEGGIILTNRAQLAEQLQQEYDGLTEYSGTNIVKLIIYAMALNVLMHPRLFWLPKGLPFLRLGETIFDTNFNIKKLSAFQAGLAKNWFSRLPAIQQTRAEQVTKWQQLLADDGFLQSSDVYPLIRYPVQLPQPQRQLSILQQGACLGVAGGYPTAVHQIAELKDMFSGKEYPVATSLAQKLITLPVHGYVTRSDRDRIQPIISGGGIL